MCMHDPVRQPGLQQQLQGVLERLGRGSGIDAGILELVASLLDDFSHFLERTRTMNLTDEGVGYNKVPLELSDEELKSLSAQVNQAFGPYLANTPRPDRRRRIITSIIMPDLNEID